MHGCIAQNNAFTQIGDKSGMAGGYNQYRKKCCDGKNTMNAPSVKRNATGIRPERDGS